MKKIYCTVHIEDTCQFEISDELFARLHSPDPEVLDAARDELHELTTEQDPFEPIVVRYSWYHDPNNYKNITTREELKPIDKLGSAPVNGCDGSLSGWETNY